MFGTKINTDPEKIKEILERGVAEIIHKERLQEHLVQEFL